MSLMRGSRPNSAWHIADAGPVAMPRHSAGSPDGGHGDAQFTDAEAES